MLNLSLPFHYPLYKTNGRFMNVAALEMIKER